MAYAQITLSELQSRLGDRYEAGAFWTAEEARLAINEALRIYNMLTGVFRTTVPVIVPANDEFVSLPGSLTYRTRITLGGRPLNFSSLASMDNARPNWRSENTSSGGSVPTSTKVWVPAGLTLVFIWPKHTVDQTLSVEGVTTAPILVNAGDTIDIGQEDIGPLLGYALHVLAFKEGGLRFQGTLKYYKAFILACAEKNERIKQSNLWKWAQGLDLTRGENQLQ